MLDAEDGPGAAWRHGWGLAAALLARPVVVAVPYDQREATMPLEVPKSNDVMRLRDDPEGIPPSSKCFALVRAFDTKPKRRRWEALQAQGMQANQQGTFFSDG